MMTGYTSVDMDVPWWFKLVLLTIFPKRKRLLIVTVTIFKEYLIVTVTIFKKYLIVTIDFSGREVLLDLQLS